MVKARRFNALHDLRLKLKSGYLKEEPAAYTFMKRYPPLNNDQNILARKPKHVDVKPLGRIYNRVVEKNSLYVDEKVYPAYWKHEPQAFTLAKKQYEYMNAGMKEEEAYKKAVQYVDELEDRSYGEMKDLVQFIAESNAQLPRTVDEKVSQKISFWREKMQATPYESLPLAEKGEVDFIVQTDVLKWNEVERERRMRSADNRLTYVCFLTFFDTETPCFSFSSRNCAH